MCQYLVVEYMATHQKYVPVSSCKVYGDTSEISAISSRTVHDVTSEMCQYLVVQYRKKHQKYVTVSSCRVYDEISILYVSI